MVWVPARMALVVNDAWLVPELIVPVPMLLPSTRNVTVPVGTPRPLPFAVKAAVNLTEAPFATGLLGLAVRVEPRPFCVTLSVPLRVPDWKLLSPLYAMLMVSAPAGRAALLIVAVQVPAARVQLPRVVPE